MIDNAANDDAHVSVWVLLLADEQRTRSGSTVVEIDCCSEYIVDI